MSIYSIILILCLSFTNLQLVFTHTDASEINEFLVFMSKESLTEYLNVSHQSASTNLLLLITPKLQKKLLCNSPPNDLKSECSRSLINQELKYFHGPLNVIGRVLNNSMSPKCVRDIYSEIQSSYLSSIMTSSSDTNRKLQAVLLIGDSKLISLFDVFLGDIGAPIVALDTHRLLKFNEFQTPKSIRFADAFHYLNPSTKNLFKILMDFQSQNHLQGIDFFVSDPLEIRMLVKYKATAYSSIKSVQSALQLANHMTRVKANFSKLEKFYTSSRNLLVFKCSVSVLEKILCSYGKVRERNFPYRISKDTEFFRTIIWISAGHENNIDSGEINCRNHHFRIYRLRLQLDIDKTLDKLIEQVTILNTDLAKIPAEKMSEQFSQANFHLQLLQPVAINHDSNNATARDFIFKETPELSKPSYRIVLQQLEPFLIVSEFNEDDRYLDPHSDQCKDGLTCFEVSDIEMSLPQENITNFRHQFRNIFKKELLINLIQQSKQLPNFDSPLIKKRCCTGYIINLLESLSNDLNFNMNLYFIRDGKSGHLESGIWNGAVSHVVSGAAHLAAGPFSLTADRAMYVDFSVPFLYSKYALLFRHVKKGNHDLFMFLKPFPNLHWISLALVAILAAVAMSMLEFISPFGLNPRGRQRARNYTLGSGISMAISLMFNHTMPFKSPKSWAGKWTQNYIAVFAICFIAQYTAQMASILSAGDTSPVTNGIYDTDILRTKRGYLGGGSINSHICHNPNKFFVSICQDGRVLENDEDGIKSVINGSLDVYLSDYLALDYMVFKQTDCSLKLRSEDFAINGYALALSKDLMSGTDKDLINIRLLEYYERGMLDELYTKWFKKRITCIRKPSDDKIRIDVDQYKGVFIFVFIGMCAAVIVLFFEQALYKWTIPFLRNKPRKSEWKSLKLMFISQRFYRIVHSIEYFDASHSAKEFLNVFRRRDFEAIFQKSFRKKQLEQNGSQLRKRPKLWALIEASTEKPETKPSDLTEEIDPIEQIALEPGEKMSDSIIVVKLEDSEDSLDKTNDMENNGQEFLDTADSGILENYKELKIMTRLTMRDLSAPVKDLSLSDNEQYDKFFSEVDDQVRTPDMELPEETAISGKSLEDISERNCMLGKLEKVDNKRGKEKIIARSSSRGFSIVESLFRTKN